MKLTEHNNNTFTNRFFYQPTARLISFIIRHGARFLTGARSLWVGCEPTDKQRIYYANHNSHIDFILLWSSLPKPLRKKTRPVAASDYWFKDELRRFLMQKTFSGISVSRQNQNGADPLSTIKDALKNGDSIIFFPEGTRNLNEDVALLNFKSGLYHLAQQFPDVEIIPVWISNLQRVMPKGAFLPLPLLSTVVFGSPLQVNPEWDKAAFLNTAQQKLLELKQLEVQ